MNLKWHQFVNPSYIHTFCNVTLLFLSTKRKFLSTFGVVFIFAFAKKMCGEWCWSSSKPGPWVALHVSSFFSEPWSDHVNRSNLTSGIPGASDQGQIPDWCASKGTTPWCRYISKAWKKSAQPGLDQQSCLTDLETCE